MRIAYIEGDAWISRVRIAYIESDAWVSHMGTGIAGRLRMAVGNGDVF
jgi:hypothetical protein